MKNQIKLLKGRMLVRGYMIEEWASANGYKRAAVYSTIYQYWDRPEKIPKVLLVSEMSCCDSRGDMLYA